LQNVFYSELSKSSCNVHSVAFLYHPYTLTSFR